MSLAESAYFVASIGVGVIIGLGIVRSRTPAECLYFVGALIFAIAFPFVLAAIS